MKEITAIIRMNMINPTKAALLDAGFPSFTCTKVLGRGKKNVNYTVKNEEEVLDSGLQKGELEEVSEYYRLIPKRLITILVNDEDVDLVVETIINTNRTNNPGDGRIFVANVPEVIRVRTNERGELAI